MSKVVCIKKVLIEKINDNNSIYNKFIIGELYEYNFKLGEEYPYKIIFLGEKTYFNKQEMDEFFIPLEEWREQKINKILEDD